MPDIQDLKTSAEKLAEQARETAEIGIAVVREKLHEMIKDPEARRRVEEAEAAIDRQVQETSRKIEENARDMMNLVNDFLARTPLGGAPIFKGTKPEQTGKPEPRKVEVERQD